MRHIGFVIFCLLGSPDIGRVADDIDIAIRLFAVNASRRRCTGCRPVDARRITANDLAALLQRQRGNGGSGEHRLEMLVHLVLGDP